MILNPVIGGGIKIVNGRITVSDTASVTIPELIGKENFVITLVSAELNTSDKVVAMTNRYVLSASSVGGTLSVTYHSNKYVETDETILTYDETTGTITLLNGGFLDVFYTADYYYVGW